MSKFLPTLLIGVLLTGSGFGAEPSAPASSFGREVALVKKYTSTIVLSDPSGDLRVLLAPDLQGRVLTSTDGGENGPSFGWINHDLIASGKIQPHINAYGGEDRIWLGPEGGQFSIFFAAGAPFDLAHWQTPPPLDSQPFSVVSHSPTQAKFRQAFSVVNYSGTTLKVRIDREVQLLDPASAWKALQLTPPAGIRLVAYETVNQLTNAGDHAWTKSTGLLSIWILGQHNASPQTTIMVPFREGTESELGKIVTSDYFGQVLPERLVIRDGAAFFKGDAHYRSKIGVSPRRAKSILGSYSATDNVLTLVQFNLPAGATDYVNSQWKIQDNPFGGDTVNSYNDGPNVSGSSLGNFYEMETSSPAAALAPGASIEHRQRTFHLTGDKAQLDLVAQAVLGVSLKNLPF